MIHMKLLCGNNIRHHVTHGRHLHIYTVDAMHAKGVMNQIHIQILSSHKSSRDS